LDTDTPLGDRPNNQPSSSPDLSSDVQGVGRLVVDGIVGLTDIVEAMHGTIAGLAPLVGSPRPTRTTGITGLVYRSIRGLSRLVGRPIDAVLGRVPAPLTSPTRVPEREAIVAALNGILGDHLAAANNPLALPMQLRTNGEPLTLSREGLEEAIPTPSSKLLVLVHGLCMSDLGWSRQGHNHGLALADALGYTPLFLHYNSGRSISTNGREFATLMERLLREWPVPVHEVAILGHSMGGLVARSAAHHARLAPHMWLRRLNSLVFLGTPHHGAPLERAGHWVDVLARVSPYTAPLARLGTIRSAGVTDLRYGMLVDADRDRPPTDEAYAPPPPVPLPPDTDCFAIAARIQQDVHRTPSFLLGDGLVPVTSALGRHDNPTLSLPIPPTHQRIFSGITHFDLLSSREVCAQLRHWLTATSARLRSSPPSYWESSSQGR